MTADPTAINAGRWLFHSEADIADLTNVVLLDATGCWWLQRAAGDCEMWWQHPAATDEDVTGPEYPVLVLAKINLEAELPDTALMRVQCSWCGAVLEGAFYATEERATLARLWAAARWDWVLAGALDLCPKCVGRLNQVTATATERVTADLTT